MLGVVKLAKIRFSLLFYGVLIFPRLKGFSFVPSFVRSLARRHSILHAIRPSFSHPQNQIAMISNDLFVQFVQKALEWYVRMLKAGLIPNRFFSMLTLILFLAVMPGFCTLFLFDTRLLLHLPSQSLFAILPFIDLSVAMVYCMTIIMMWIEFEFVFFFLSSLCFQSTLAFITKINRVQHRRNTYIGRRMIEW